MNAPARDGQAVFAGLAEAAARLSEALEALIYQEAGDQLRLVARHGTPRAMKAGGKGAPPARTTIQGRAFLDRATIRNGAQVAAPILVNGRAVGAIVARRDGARPFSPAQVGRLEAFAAHAAIVIQELGARDRELAEALAQQSATAEIIRAISSSTDMRRVFDMIAEGAVRLCRGEFGGVFQFDGRLIHLLAQHGLSPDGADVYARQFPRQPGRESAIGRALLDRAIAHIVDVRKDPEYGLTALAVAGAMRCVVAVPVLREGHPIGGIVAWRPEPKPFSDRQIELLKTFADQTLIAIENARLVGALETRNDELTESLEQQTATAEILRAISGSPTDIQPVLDTVVRAAARFCGATDVVLLRLEDTTLRGAAGLGQVHDAAVSQLGRVDRLEIPVTRGSVSGRAVMERRTVHVHDLPAEAEDEFPEGRVLARRFGHRTTLAAPLLREGTPLGAIALFRGVVDPFSDKQLELLRTFADQAVIAIENVRLFTALEARNRDLTESLEQQTATSEILRIISTSPTDLEPVLQTVAANAARLCGADDGHIWQRDGDELRLAVSWGGRPVGRRQLTISRQSVMGRAVSDRAPIHLEDLAEVFLTEYPDSRAMKELGYRTILAMPLLREGVAIGVIMIRRTEVRPFTDRQVELVKTFADQAVIAIENVRLFTELEAKNRDLTETLEQQTATGEILRVISSSPTDVQPVFDTIAQSAKRLCAAEFCLLYRFDGTLLHFVAHHGLSLEGVGAVQRVYPIAPDRASASSRSVLSGAVEHIPDVEADPDYRHGELARIINFRSIVGVPILRDGAAIGAIAVARVGRGPFPDRQLDLLKTFADQAVIAIENVRLFTELEARNRDLTETLEQQTATGEILRVISSSPTDVQPVFNAIAEAAMRLCGAASGIVTTFDGELMHLSAQAQIGPEGTEVFRRVYPRPPSRGFASARAVLTRAIVHINDVLADPEYEHRDLAHAAAFRGVLAVPMLRDGLPIGTINVHKLEPGLFADTQVELLKTFAAQAVIAIENVRLFTELDAKNRDLTETLEQQTATSEILRVISSSPTDVQPVFDTIAESAARLCEARDAVVYLADGEALRPVARHGPVMAGPVPLVAETVGGRTVIERRTVHVADVQAEVVEFPVGAAISRQEGTRSMLSVPLLHEDRAIGTIALRRFEVRPFSEAHVKLLQTFAAQAVIAIQNVRLFTELEARNKALTETLEQQTATSEVLKVISRSTFDLQPVLETVVESATRLCGATRGHIFRFDGEFLRFAAAHGASPGFKDYLETHPTRLGPGSVAGMAAADRRTMHVPDVLQLSDYEQQDLVKQQDYRAVLAVPMLREGALLGVIAIVKPKAEPFTDKQIELVTTFADQAVIAIENVRLFTALEARNRDLTETLEQQTATSEILRVISQSPTDAGPVFEIIGERARRLCEADVAVISRFDGKLLQLVELNGLVQEGVEAMRRLFPLRPDMETMTTRAFRTRAVVHVEDVLGDARYEIKDVARASRYRGGLAVPMLREGQVIGVIFVGRERPGLFADTQVELLKTFADQAVIAIENVRLFTELEARTQDLTRSVGELKALGEVSQALSSTLELETVLETIVRRAVELSDAAGGAIYGFDETSQEFRLQASHRMEEELLATLRASPLRLGEGTTGQAGLRREPVEVTDIADPSQYGATRVRTVLVELGYHSLLSVPLLQDQRLLGALTIWRRVAGRFPEEVVNLLRTLATQSSLAIHNAGLFREIQRRKQYADSIVETSPVAIVTIDLAGRVVSWNPGAERLFGHAEADALGRSMEDLMATPETREDVRANIRRTLAGESIRAIGRRAKKDGTQVDVEISSVPVVVDGVEMGMIGIYHDITDLLRARREAEAANEAKSAFLATMSHEIRTPLNAVIGMSGLLLNTPLADEQREYAEIVRQSGDALLTVINDILDFSKIEAGRLELEAQPFDLRECVEGALDLVATRAAEKGLDLAYVVGDGTPPAIVGDVTRLRQVLLNLLSNAVKFTERGEVVVSVSARRQDGSDGLNELTFVVRDTGIGIPPDRISRLFQSFSQVDASTTRRYGGTGLGLAISQRLTELMGGRIAVTSEVGTGSEFRFAIRAPAAEALPVHARRDLSGIQHSIRGKHVLVVDDNATNRRIVTTHLGTWGLPARATESPREAVEWIRGGERFDVGILDMHMPEMDGVALARAIRTEPAGAAVPLILFTSLGRREARAEEEGFAAYLHKPIKPSQLFDALVSVLGDQPVHIRERGVARHELDPDMASRHPLRILQAEDNVVNQKVALRLLVQMGYRADVASNGLEAVDAVERQTYDVVLMDVQMPELDGFEASREINRRWPGDRRPRIVAMTANAMQGDRELCVAAGMDDYVAKPIRIDELVTALERTPRRTDGASGGAATSRPTDGAATGASPVESGTKAGSRDPGGTPPAGAIDRATFDSLTRTMGGAFVAELIDTFVEDAQELTAQLPTALGRGDVDGFRRAAHSLKSTSESLGAMDLAAVARELETIARAGSLEGVGERLGRVADEYARAAHALRKLRSDLSA